MQSFYNNLHSVDLLNIRESENAQYKNDLGCSGSLLNKSENTTLGINILPN